MEHIRILMAERRTDDQGEKSLGTRPDIKVFRKDVYVQQVKLPKTNSINRITSFYCLVAET